MRQPINGKGLGYAEPAILAREALEMYGEITIAVDERKTLENIEFLGMHMGYSGMQMGYLVDVTGETGDVYWIHLKKAKLDGKRPGRESGYVLND